MDTKYALRRKEATNGLQPETVIANWLKAIYLLDRNYKQLTTCINDYRLHQKLSEKTTKAIGQCPMSQIIKLQNLFQNEMRALLLDMNTFTKRNTIDSLNDYKKLANHTLILNKLNNQAQTRLHLTREPAS